MYLVCSARDHRGQEQLHVPGLHVVSPGYALAAACVTAALEALAMFAVLVDCRLSGT